jgi:hypothetical protein
MGNVLGGNVLTFRFRHGAHENALFLVALADDMVIQGKRRRKSGFFPICLWRNQKARRIELTPRFTM